MERDRDLKIYFFKLLPVNLGYLCGGGPINRPIYFNLQPIFKVLFRRGKLLLINVITLKISLLLTATGGDLVTKRS